ncbi:hypothetical protein ABVK25_008355 [Lepraria finkii]|uniref:Uncharacterized protein n=1 Tax=Lepraria finkii TaxID=1340010 RepID=A0ABR4B1N9_9LECA
MVLLEANENALGPALVLQNDRLFNDTSSASTNISKKLDIDSVNLNRYPDPRQLESKHLFWNFRNTGSKTLKPENSSFGAGSDEAVPSFVAFVFQAKTRS